MVNPCPDRDPAGSDGKDCPQAFHAVRASDETRAALNFDDRETQLLIERPSRKWARRIFPIVSTQSIPSSLLRINERALKHIPEGVTFACRSPPEEGHFCMPIHKNVLNPIKNLTKQRRY